MIKIKFAVSTLLFMLIINSCQSQISLSKEFDENEYICSYQHFEGVDLYATFDSDNNEIKFYNSNHQVESSMVYDPGTNYNLVQIFGISKDVFNNDDNIEFYTYKINADGSGGKTIVMNDQNTIIEEFNMGAQLRIIANKYYFYGSEHHQTINQSKKTTTNKLYEVKGKFRKIAH